MEISLHGITRETFERVTLGQVSYDRCLQAIALLLDQQIHLVLKSAVMTLNRQEILDIKHYVESLGTVRYKLGEEMRPELDDGAGPFQYALCEQSSERTICLIQYGAFSRRIHQQAAAHQRVIKAQFELTYRCNRHCRHCYTDPYNSKEFFPRELTLDDIHRLLDEMQQLGIVWPI